MVVIHFRRNHQVSIENKTSRVISRKIRGSRKSRASKIAKQRKTGQHTGVQQGCTAVHPRQQPKKSAQPVHGQPCLDARPCIGGTRPCVGARSPVRLCTGGRASGRLRKFAFFSVFIFQYCFIFGWLLGFFWSTLGRKLGFSIALINSIREN